VRELVDRLPAVHPLGPCRRVRPALRRPAGPARRGRPHRLAAGQRRLDQHPRPEKGAHTGANPTDRGKAGSKLHLAVDGSGIPLSVLLTAANPHDCTLLEPVLDDLPALPTPAGGRRRRPDKVHADKAYDHRRCRAYLHRRRIKVRIARRGIDSSQRLGRHRWTVERTIAWLLGCRRLRTRYDRSDEHFYAFVLLANALVCYRTLTSPPW
jgi:transposase